MTKSRFQKIKTLSAWRKLSLAFWRTPNDPSVYGHFEINAETLINDLTKRKLQIPQLTLTTLVAKALGLTIAKHPNINGIIKWGNIYQRQSVDLFLQVVVKDASQENSHHLSGVKVYNIDQKSLQQIDEEIRSKSKNIKNNDDKEFGTLFKFTKICPTFLLRWSIALQGFLSFNLGLNLPRFGLHLDPFGSAMLTSIGSLGLTSGFAPLVPSSRTPLIVTLGAVQKKAWVEGEKLVIKPILEFSITFDHRFMDGWHAAQMHQTLCGFLMHPELLDTYE